MPKSKNLGTTINKLSFNSINYLYEAYNYLLSYIYKAYNYLLSYIYKAYKYFH